MDICIGACGWEYRVAFTSFLEEYDIKVMPGGKGKECMDVGSMGKSTSSIERCYVEVFWLVTSFRFRSGMLAINSHHHLQEYYGR